MWPDIDCEFLEHDRPMSESRLDFEVNLEGEIIPQVPEDSLESAEQMVESEPGKENATKTTNPSSTMLFDFGFGFLRPAREEVDNFVPLDNTVGPNSTIDESEELETPGVSDEDVIETPMEEVKPVEHAKAVISPVSSPLRPTPMSPTRSLLSLFQRGGSPTSGNTQSHVYQEKSQMLDSDSDDDRSLEEAQTAEQLLGSTMRFAEEETGENFFSLSHAPRLDAIELGQRVSTLPTDKARTMGRSPSILLDDDDASIQSWASQATETSFIKVDKADPGTFSREYWGGIIASMSLDGDEARSDGVHPEPSFFNPSQTKSPPRNERTSMSSVASPSNRKWDKLRNTIQAQEMGKTIDPDAPASRFKKSMSLRVPKIGLRQAKSKDEGDAIKHIEPRKTVVIVPRSKSTDEGDAPRSAASLIRSIGSLRQVKSHDDYEDFNLALGPLPPVSNTPGCQPQIVDGPSDVRISVEDLSKANVTKEDASKDNSMDATVASRDSDPESSIDESMEVLFLGEKKSWLGGKGRIKTEIQG